jgi:hypothetical protein
MFRINSQGSRNEVFLRNSICKDCWLYTGVNAMLTFLKLSIFIYHHSMLRFQVCSWGGDCHQVCRFTGLEFTIRTSPM